MGPFWMEQLDGNQWDFGILDGILVWDFKWISNGHRWESMDGNWQNPMGFLVALDHGM
jgi:hypothetical protein